MSIERNFNKYLFNLVKSKAMDNRIAKTIVLNYQRLNRDTKEKFFESLMLAYANFTDSAFESIKFEETSNLNLTERNKDFRLKSVRIANVRGIPEMKNNIKYGFDLFENGQIQNAVFLGPNGTGKSSIFNPIEFIYSHEVAEKKLRVKNPESLNENDFLKYLEHFNEAPECEVETPAGKFSLRNRIFKSVETLKTIYPDSHFISDYDIYSKGHINYLGKNDESESFHLLIASSLGLQDYLDFTNLLKSIATYRRSKEANERNKLLSNRNTLTEEIRKNQEQINTKSEKIKELKGTITENSGEDSRDKLATIISAIKANSYTFPFEKTEYEKVFDNYKDARETFLGLSVNPNLQTEAQFLSLGLELINHSENCPLCENSKSSVPDIKKKIENRILEIKEFETASKSLESNIRSIQNSIKEILIKLQSLERILRIEIESITAVSELETIHKNGKFLIALLSNEINKFTEVDNSFSNIISSNDVLAHKNEEIFKIFLNTENFYINDLSNLAITIEEFSKIRLKRITEIESKLASMKINITPRQQILILESEIKNHQTTVNINGQQIKTIERDIEKLTLTLDTITEIKSKAGDFAKTLDFEVNKLVANAFEPIKETITSILSDYLKEENVSLQIKLEEKASDNDPESIETTILAEIERINTQTGEIEIHSPSKYFNTFRFRLFCTMVSLSVVIAARKNSGINLPLVLDDVFYASDYSSKTTFRQFLSTVFSIFRKFNGEMPFQLILFTHDELVFDAAIDAIAEFELEEFANTEEFQCEQWKEPIQNRTVFARLFPAKEVDAKPTVSPFGDYWDLTYRIPTQLEHLLKLA